MTTQTATILVTDLVGSTALRSELGEERAEAVRRAHDRALIDAAEANGGTVVKGLGDGVLVMFAGAAEAVAAAVAMQRAVELQARQEGLGLAIRVGVSAGDVTLEDGDCFGTPVIEASRLCAAADGEQILVADVVRVLARGRGGHELTAVGDLELAGLAEPVPTFAVGWERASGPADLRTRTPYVGRERERELLRGRLAAVHEGTGGLVLIAGEPGIGKTRLAAEVCAEHDDLTVLIGGCHDGDVVPYAPFAEAFTDWAERAPIATVTEALRADAAIVARLAPAIRHVVPETGEPLPVTPDAETARLHDAVGQVLTRLSASAPVVLVVEDLHWADEGTVAMLRALARLATRTRLVIIGTYRETDLDRRHPFAHALPLLQRETEVTRIALEGLGATDVHALLERLSGHDVPETFASMLASETDGNPFFLRETLLHLVEEGRLRVEDGTWVADAGDLSIPAGVRDVVGRRLSRLSDDANRLLAAGALFEVSFPLTIAAAVSDIDEARALDAIDEALEARIVTATDEFDRYAFTHALFRHTLVDELNPSRQVRMHRAIAEAIEKDLRGPLEPQTAAALARHYQRSAAIPGAERGVRYAIAVADDAAGRYARHEELAALELGLELAEPGDERAATLHRRAAIVSVMAQIDADEQLARAAIATELVDEDEGPDAACDFATELVATARRLDNVSTTWRLAALARRWLRADRRDEQWAYLREAELDERDFHDPRAPGIPVDDEDHEELRRVVAGLPPPVADTFRCNAPASRADADERLARYPFFAAFFGSGRFREALPTLDEHTAAAEREHLVGLTAFFTTMRSRLKAVLGDLDGAVADEQAALALLPRIAPESNAYLQVLGTPMLRAVLCGEGLGRDYVEVLLAFAEHPDTEWASLVLRLAAARALAELGDPDPALEILDAAMPGMERAAAWAPNAPLVFAQAVQVVWISDRTDHVEDLERIVRAKWLEPDLCYPIVDARWHLALLCALGGRVEEARARFEDARRVLAAQECEPVIVHVDHDAALMELRLGPEGDPALLASCIAAARARCTHPTMAPWHRRFDELEARAASTG